MTPLERLFAEAIPDGTFGGPRYREPEPRQPATRRETTPGEAARRQAALLAELQAWDHAHHRPLRHLRAVPPAA